MLAWLNAIVREEHFQHLDQRVFLDLWQCVHPLTHRFRTWSQGKGVRTARHLTYSILKHWQVLSNDFLPLLLVDLRKHFSIWVASEVSPQEMYVEVTFQHYSRRELFSFLCLVQGCLHLCLVQTVVFFKCGPMRKIFFILHRLAFFFLQIKDASVLTSFTECFCKHVLFIHPLSQRTELTALVEVELGVKNHFAL